MKASTLGAAMVANKSRVPTPNPASSLAVIFSISFHSYLSTLSSLHCHLASIALQPYQNF